MDREVDVLTQPLALWKNEKEFLDWCWKNNVMGMIRGNNKHCLVACALNKLTGSYWMVGQVAAMDVTKGNLVALPGWMCNVISLYDRGCLSLHDCTLRRIVVRDIWLLKERIKVIFRSPKPRREGSTPSAPANGSVTERKSTRLLTGGRV